MEMEDSNGISQNKSTSTSTGVGTSDSSTNTPSIDYSRTLGSAYFPYGIPHLMPPLMPHSVIPTAMGVPAPLGPLMVTTVCDSRGCQEKAVSIAPPPPSYDGSCILDASSTCGLTPDPTACMVGATLASHGGKPPVYDDFYSNYSAAWGYSKVSSGCSTGIHYDIVDQ